MIIINFFKKNIHLVILVVFTFFFTNCIGQFTITVGASMENTFHNGDLLFLEKITKTFKNNEYNRYDVIVFESGDKSEPYYIKRIIGLPGETIKLHDGNIYINDELLNDDIYGKDRFNFSGLASEEIELRSDEYFVLGDNRNNSKDSRMIGPIDKSIIYGKIAYSIQPFGPIK